MRRRTLKDECEQTAPSTAELRPEETSSHQGLPWKDHVLDGPDQLQLRRRLLNLIVEMREVAQRDDDGPLTTTSKILFEIIKRAALSVVRHQAAKQFRENRMIIRDRFGPFQRQ